MAKDTTVRPMIIFDNFSFRDNPTEDRTKNSPPITRSTNPIIR
ncbi:hypothetical protein DDD_2776 [Nonlabens dokdonensis DSW-6]|uniref:Uncharacterized protein n=1 Tax=Nonlabens dokdonensis (strain DSM 17205 / KCTC 12402 / DSW-6) TaxID=592029 RepID=L7WG67_NONDD|nr:hypothetical protein DDD_2776 [Nonlabens dokdonensis DSW-6]